MVDRFLVAKQLAGYSSHSEEQSHGFRLVGTHHARVHRLLLEV
jgi:hypothetical protein